MGHVVLVVGCLLLLASSALTVLAAQPAVGEAEPELSPLPGMVIEPAACCAEGTELLRPARPLTDLGLPQPDGQVYLDGLVVSYLLVSDDGPEDVFGVLPPFSTHLSQPLFAPVPHVVPIATQPWVAAPLPPVRAGPVSN